MTIRAFISYSHKDADLLTQLHEHLSALKRQNLLDAWTDREIPPGGVIDEHIDQRIEESELYLLLISSSFIQSDYCFNLEFNRVCERQRLGDSIIIVPIILRECDWKIPELKRFKALPEDGKPVISRHWHSPDEAFSNVVSGLRKIIENGQFTKLTIRNTDKNKKDKFIPNEHHVSEAQRTELRKLTDEVVDRLTTRHAAESDDVVKKVKGKNFGIVWSQFNKYFNIVEHGLQSLPSERFDEAKQWLLQYRASKDKNYKRVNPQKYRNTLTKTIYTLAKTLGWTNLELYSFVSEKVGYSEPINGLSDLGNSQLELVRDRIRYENIKSIVKRKQAIARKNIESSQRIIQKSKLLFVDDELYASHEYIENIENYFDVDTANNVNEALYLADKYRNAYKVIILDIMMEHGSYFNEIETAGGYRTGKVLSQELRNIAPESIIIALTLSTDPEIEEWFSQERMYYLSKRDILPTKLLETILGIINKERQ